MFVCVTTQFSRQANVRINEVEVEGVLCNDDCVHASLDAGGVVGTHWSKEARQHNLIFQHLHHHITQLLSTSLLRHTLACVGLHAPVVLD